MMCAGSLLTESVMHPTNKLPKGVAETTKGEMAVGVPSAGIHSQIFNSTITQIAPAGAALRGWRTEIEYWMDK